MENTEHENGAAKAADGGETLHSREFSKETFDSCKDGLDNLIKRLIALSTEKCDMNIALAADILMQLYGINTDLVCVKADKSETDEAKRMMSEMEERQAAGNFAKECMAAVMIAHFKARNAETFNDEGEGSQKPADGNAENKKKEAN